jgi:Putative peptidoglycan binding domain
MTATRVLVAAASTAAAIAAAVILATDPFGGTGSAQASLDNGTPTALSTVRRQDLSSQTQVSATLGYADSSTIAVPAGTAPASVQQAEQAAATAQASLDTAVGALADDTQALTQAESALAADRAKLTVDCEGVGAAAAPASRTDTTGGGASAPCAADAQAIAADQQAATTAASKVEADRRSVASARTSLADANAALDDARSSAALYGQTSVYTMLPKVGAVVRLGQPLYAIGGEPVLLLYGHVTPWRAFTPGMTPGRDVAALNASLRALGYGAPAGDSFTSETGAAIEALQEARGAEATGRLLLGSVVFEAGAIRVTTVTPTVGVPVQAGAVLGVTSTRRVVTIALDASQQTSVKVGDPVTITMPDNSTTPGRVSYVGTVATTPSSSDQNGGGSSSPTIEVDVTPDDPGATGRLDQAPVDVSITTATVRNVLVVPVTALIALAGGGYAVEEVERGGTHHLVGVTVGLFDDADGLVQVSGSGLAAGQRVVVPAS